MRESDIKRKQAQQQIDNLCNAYKAVFDSDVGKKVYEDLRLFCGQDSPSVCEQHPDALQTMFNEGKRRVFLRIQGFSNRKVTNE